MEGMGRRKRTVSEGDDLARAFGLGHSPDVLYRIGLAFAGLAAEVVREVRILADLVSVGGDPVKTEERESDVGFGDGGEEELCVVEVDLDEGEAGEGGGQESHGEQGTVRGDLYIIFCAVGSLPSERNRSETGRVRAISRFPFGRSTSAPASVNGCWPTARTGWIVHCSTLGSMQASKRT